MNKLRLFPLTLIAIAIAALAGCNSMPVDSALLQEARSDYRIAQDTPQTRDLAAVEMMRAGDALNRANEASTRRDKPAEVDHLAYLAKQRVAIAQETGRQKAAEAAVGNADAARDKVRLAARTNEADAAQRSAEASQRSAEASQRQADASQKQADNSQRQAAASQRQASDAQARSTQLEAQIKDLNAKQTDRGLVVTLGDVLFDTNKSQLRSGGLRSVEKLVGFLKEYPQRTALIEGFTDSIGAEGSNRDLSDRRADAVRAALLDLGVNGGRVATRGYGEAYPVASNDSADGRQMNRRVEIVLSDDSGSIAPR